MNKEYVRNPGVLANHNEVICTGARNFEMIHRAQSKDGSKAEVISST